MRREFFPIALGVLLLVEIGCTPPPDDNPFSSFNPTLTSTVTLTGNEAEESDEESGDGDGDPTQDMAGTGDGDGDGDGDGEPGDGDGEPGDGDGDGEPGCNWMPNPDQNPSATCDPILQDCPANQKCVAYESISSWDNNKCVPVSGNKLPGQQCSVDSIQSGIDDCNADSQCFNLDLDNNGTCLAFCGCTYEDPECAPGSSCLVANEGSIALCVDGCDPLLQDCPIGEGCYPSGETLICAATTTDLGPGETCGFINDCAAGLACYNIDACGGLCCTPFCDLQGDDSECAVLPGTTCSPSASWGICG